MAELGNINSQTEIYDASEIDNSSDLVHLGTGGEIAGINEITTPANSDKILIERAADTDSKNYVELGNFAVIPAVEDIKRYSFMMGH